MDAEAAMTGADDTTIHALVRKRETAYIIGNTKLSKYVQFSMFDTISRVEAYLNSKHITGEQDSLGRDKPFLNIITAAVNVWWRATDLDTKDVRIRATRPTDEIKAFLAMIHLQLWMKHSEFGYFLNQWGRVLAAYGSAVTKFVVKNGELNISVIPWNRLIVDAIDFHQSPVIEKLYYTPSQLRKAKMYDQAEVAKLIAAANQPRKTIDRLQKDILSDYIEVYEVHGEFSVAQYKRHKGLKVLDGDDTVYRPQMYVVSFYQKEDKDDEFDDFTLYCGYEKRSPYMITHMIEEDGRTLSIGAVEHLFDAQWMTNHSMKNMKDTLDLTSKQFYQTEDGNFAGRNVLSGVETGDIFTYAAGKPLSPVNNGGATIAALLQFEQKWETAGQDITSTPAVMRGMVMSGGAQAYRQAALLVQQADALFEIMTQNKGLAIEHMMREFIIPFIQTQLKNGDDIAATLESYNLKKIDAMYVPTEAINRFNERTIQQMLANAAELAKGNIPTPMQQFNPQAEQASVQRELALLGNMRYFTPDEAKKLNWAQVFKDFEWDCEVDVTSENDDQSQTLATLQALLATAQNNPELYKLVSDKILEETGIISPIEVQTANIQPPQPQPAQMQPAPTGG